MEQLETLSLSISKRLHKARFGLIVGYGFFINAVVGAGFLSIPFAYQVGGWLLALFLQTSCILLGLLFSNMTLETTALAASIEELIVQGHDMRPVPFSKLFRSSQKPEFLIERPIPTPKLNQHQYDISHMIDLTLGRKWSTFYIVSLCIVFFGSLIAYASIFGTSFVSTIPLGAEGTCNVYNDSAFDGNCRWKYMIFVAIYGAFMVYFTIVGFKKQWWMQIALTFMRFLVMLLVVVCCIAALVSHTQLDSSKPAIVEMPPLANFSQLGTIFSILLFSCLYQTNIPSIAVHIEDKAKNMPRILIMITVTLLVVYVPMGLIAPPATTDLSSMVTLSFNGYTAGGTSHHGREWTYIIEYIVIIFPALDVFSVFPIMAITLADNITGLIYKQNLKEVPSRVRCTQQMQIILRLCVAIPPLLLALLEFNLGVILTWAGLFGFIVIPLVVPLQMVAARKMLPVESPYTVKRCPNVRFSQWLALTISMSVFPILVALVILNILVAVAG